MSPSPPTGTFHNTKSSRWIQNFTSLVSAEGSSYRDEKVSQRKDLGNQYLKQSVRDLKKSNRRPSTEYADQPVQSRPKSIKNMVKQRVQDLNQPGRLSKTEMQEKLRFLHQQLGAVMKGYKCRRIYHNNKIIGKYRQDFRDLIHFAYSLKQEIMSLRDKTQIENSKRMLLTSLKDLIAKR